MNVCVHDSEALSICQYMSDDRLRAVLQCQLQHSSYDYIDNIQWFAVHIWTPMDICFQKVIYIDFHWNRKKIAVSL